MYCGRLRRGGKSNRSGAVLTGYRSDSPGIVYQFPGSALLRLRACNPAPAPVRTAPERQDFFASAQMPTVHVCYPLRDFFCFLSPEGASGLVYMVL